MSILEYYQEKQKDIAWYNRFQSTAKDQCGKLFTCLNVNFRKLASFFTQLDEFKDKDGIRRADWNSYQENGQEKDKHRIVNLKNAGLIVNIDDKYVITEKGHEVLRINEDNDLTDREKWILLLMLIMDYKTEERSLDLIKSVIILINDLSNQGIDRTDFIKMLRAEINVNNKEQLFQSDVFWLITFAKDSEFIKKYLSEGKEEKQKLYDWVLMCSKNKKSTDCIAHKFVSGGAYSVSTFNEDINIVLSVLILASIQDTNWNGYLKVVSKLYPTCNFDKITSFVNENIEIYNKVYKNTFEVIRTKLSNQKGEYGNE